MAASFHEGQFGGEEEVDGPFPGTRGRRGEGRRSGNLVEQHETFGNGSGVQVSYSLTTSDASHTGSKRWKRETQRECRNKNVLMTIEKKHPAARMLIFFQIYCQKRGALNKKGIGRREKKRLYGSRWE